ncbi:hypothetical protein [Pseudoroseomonas cervicalis]|uniref:hypothetical protein n=1 Tax=Teichococcus cervicalis TaxID=204525 RepID=UPI0022F1C4C3|nr:hypothetical protein [Pseudoroseomonas cervicalis]WBV44141.1 hypothetical protein PFY06_06135 [Pseudoroseomonas cervicalis]
MRRAGPARPGQPAPRSTPRLAPWPGLFAALAAWAALDAARLLAWPAGLLPDTAPLLPPALAALAGLATARRWHRAAPALPGPRPAPLGWRGPLLSVLLWLALLARLLVTLLATGGTGLAGSSPARAALVPVFMALVLSLLALLLVRVARGGSGGGGHDAGPGTPLFIPGLDSPGLGSHGRADCGDGWGPVACDSGSGGGDGGGDGGGSGGE